MCDRNNFDVFINCPFDDEYSQMFDAMLFAIYFCGFIPRCTKEENNGGHARIEIINQIIGECRIGIHDISRTELDSTHNLPRFNMPFELGLFLGAKEYGGENQKNKICIIFDKEEHRYQKYLSDIAGQDIKSHNNYDIIAIIKHVRNVLNEIIGKSQIIEGAFEINKQYNRYRKHKTMLLKKLKVKPSESTYADEIKIMEQWIRETKLKAVAEKKS